MGDICRIFNININNLNWKEFLELFSQAVEDRTRNKYMLTVNVDHIVKMQEDGEFHEIYQKADYITADGVPVLWAAKLIGQPIKQKISGSDILPAILPLAEKKQYRMFFLGAAEGVAQKAADVIKEQYPDIQIVGTYSPSYGFENKATEIEKIISMIKEAKVDILFVGVGAPKQEKWIAKYKELYEVPLSLGVGATFDFIAGNVKRAPLWMQKNGLEWFWRFLQEPRRLFKRYFVDDVKFLKILLREYGRK